MRAGVLNVRLLRGIGEGRKEVPFPLVADRLPAVVPEPVFQPPEGVVVHGSDFVGDCTGVLCDSGDQPHPERRLGVDDPPREREVHRLALADDSGEPRRPAPGPEQAQPDAGLGERRLGRRHPNVAGQRQFDAAAPGRAVDTRHYRAVVARECPGDPLAQRRELACRLGVEVANDIEVSAGTERLAGTREIDHRLSRLGDGGFEFP